MLHFDICPFDVVLYEVVFDVNSFSAFDKSRVLCYKDGCLMSTYTGVGCVSGV